MAIRLISRVLLSLKIRFARNIWLACLFLLLPLAARAELALQKNDVIAIMGGANTVEMMEAGHFESLLGASHPKLNLRFKDFSWEADTVYAQGTVDERWRVEAFDDLTAQLKREGTKLVFLQFGQMESMDGFAKLHSFIANYRGLLAEIKELTDRIVIISPTLFEGKPGGVDRNAALMLYVEAMKTLASTEGCGFVDLTGFASSDHTRNGIHLRPDQQGKLARYLFGKLGFKGSYPGLESLRDAVRYRHDYWLQYQRPANWKCLFGDDKKRVFSIGDGGEAVTLQSEWRQLPALIEFAEKRIQDVLKGKSPAKKRFADVRLAGVKDVSIQSELRAFQLDDEFEIKLFAGDEKGVRNPLQMIWDSRGRIYVISTTLYPQRAPGEIPDDKILILEDSNGDGVADKTTVFADGLNIPTGIAMGQGGVYVAHGTELLFLRDTDGDDKADTRERIFAGFGEGDTHQKINTLTWTPGGMLLFGQGDGIESRVETAYGISSVFQAGFYRLNPHSLKLDPILNDFSGPANPWGIAFDEWGQCFSCDGAGDIDYITQAMLPAQRKRKIDNIGKNGGYCGLTFIGSTRFPKGMRKQFLLGGFKNNRIPRFSVHSRGSGFKLKWADPILKSSHRNFRPVALSMGPDGAVYISDWYDPITCHQNDYFRDPRRDRTHGRIWRLSVKGADGWKINLAKLSDAELVKQLASEERWYRDHARREMFNRDPKKMHEAIVRWADSDRRDDHERYEALAALATINEVDEPLLRRVLKSGEEGARAFAAEWVGHWHDRLEDPLALLEKAVVDSAEIVRLKAVLGCAHIPLARSIEVAAKVLDGDMDEGLEHALAQAADHLKEHWVYNSGDLFKGNSGHLAAMLSRVDSDDIRDQLVKLLRNQDLDASARLSVMRGLVTVGSGADLRRLLEPKAYEFKGGYDADTHAEVLGELARVYRSHGKKPSGNLAGIFKQLLEQQSVSVKRAAIELVSLWDVAEMQGRVLQMAGDERLSGELREAAVKALDGTRAPAGKFLNRILKGDAAVSMKLAALQCVARSDIDGAAGYGADFLIASSADPAAVIAVFQGRVGGLAALAVALQSRTIGKEEAKAALDAVRLSGQTDPTLTDVLSQALGLDTKVRDYDLADIVRLAKAALENGNARLGEKVFAVRGCAACHQVGEFPAVIGPSLSAVGTGMSVEQIIENVIWPARNIKEGYTLSKVTLKDGTIHQGYERKSKDQGVDFLMREMASETVKRFPRSRIESIERIGTAMPVGILAGIKPDEMRDLIAYMASLGKNVSGSGEEGFRSIFDGKTLDAWKAVPADISKAWKVEDGMIVGDGDEGKGYLMYVREKALGNFEIKLSYRFPGKGNSGISIRARKDVTGKRLFQSYHADIGHLGIGKQVLGAWDFHIPGRKEHALFRGNSMVIDKNDKATFTRIANAFTPDDINKGGWNDVHVIAKDSTFKFYINGKLSTEFTEHLPKAKRLDKGFITLQIHDPGMIVHFKDIRIKVTESQQARSNPE